MNTTLRSLADTFPDLKWQFEYPLSAQTYFKVGGPAEAYVEIKEIGVLQKVLQAAHEGGIPVTILGGASNVIVADEGVKGLVIKVGHDRVELIESNGQVSGMRAGAGIRMAALVAQMLNFNLTGLEYFLGVPGTLGGAVFNNAHYLSHLIGEHVTRVLVVNRETGADSWLTQAECAFEYDHSRFQTSGEIIIEVEFALAAGEATTSRALIKEATEYRAATQPLGEPSSGCIFQNVPNTDSLRERFPQFATRTHVPGGFLIEQAGMKGAREGEIEVSQKHAAFMINKGHGTSADLQKLITKVKGSVKAQFDVDLQEEVFYLQ